MKRDNPACRIGVDVGGTFTDVVIDHAGGRISAKVPTTPDTPETGVLEGIEAALERASVAPERVDLVIHGTTLATKCADRTQGSQDGAADDRGFPRLH